MASVAQEYGARRVYGAREGASGSVALRLKDREVELARGSYAAYEALREAALSGRDLDEVAAALGTDGSRLESLLGGLVEAGLLYRRAEIPERISGEEFHRDYFSKFLSSWLEQAFSHPFWERMMSGRGSARLFSGWLIELYHYTRNANRHMPLSCAQARSSRIRRLRARHYSEEWDHYHYFLKSLEALGFDSESVSETQPLPMTLEMSNFMRQAAREDVLAYSICSAVLEGTTIDVGAYHPFYETSAELYDIPRAAVQPIYDHLALDVQYEHSDLFLDILRCVDTISAERAGRILDYGHQLVEHIWMWTYEIEKYYGDESRPALRLPFDPTLD